MEVNIMIGIYEVYANHIEEPVLPPAEEKKVEKPVSSTTQCQRFLTEELLTLKQKVNRLCLCGANRREVSNFFISIMDSLEESIKTDEEVELIRKFRNGNLYDDNQEAIVVQMLYKAAINSGFEKGNETINFIMDIPNM
jgi:hypothetical protein